MVRVIRLFKMIRLLRASRMFKRWETRFEINYNSLALYRSVVLVVVSAMVAETIPVRRFAAWLAGSKAKD